MAAAWIVTCAVGSNVAHASSADVDRVVVVAVPGLRWGDVTATETPNLWAFAGGAARAALAVKAAGVRTDCAAGMLTIGAGNRAAGTPAANAVCTTRTVGALPPAMWDGV